MPPESRPPTDLPLGDFRASYVQALRSHQLLPTRAERPPQHQQVTIFDWDDTLLCTSALLVQERGGVAVDDNALAQLDDLGQRLLEKAVKCGPTFIITNAVEGWVEHSAMQYYPRICDVLSEVTVISARTQHEHSCPGNADAWKNRAFCKVREALPSAEITQLISIGDSNGEMRAVHSLAERFPKAVVKTVKLWEEPSAAQLVREVQILLDNFNSISEKGKNVAVSIKTAFATETAEPAADA